MLFRSIKLGHAPPPPKVPFIFEKFLGHLKGSGINVRQEGSKFHILPQTDKDITAMSNGEIKEPLSYKLKKDDLVAEDGGLFDPTITGVYGDNYNHISLNHRVPNPMAEEHVRKLLKLTKAKYEDAVANDSLVKQLDTLDTDKKIAELKALIASKRKTGRKIGRAHV